MPLLKILRPLFFICIIAPQALPAADSGAGLMLLPTRLVLEDKDYSGSVIIKNPGQATGNYSLELIDMKMEENGNIVPVETGGQAGYSAVPLLHVAPRSLTLEPGEFRKVRLMLHKPSGLQSGEYRAHLKVWIADDHAGGTSGGGRASGIAAKARLTAIIPVIFRHGDTSLAMRIEDPELSHDVSGRPVLHLYLTREGNRSAMGDIVVSQDGKAQSVIATLDGIAVYRPTPRRLVSIGLDALPQQGGLKVTYRGSEDGAILAEKTIRLRLSQAQAAAMSK